MFKNKILRKKYWVVILLTLFTVLLLGFFKQRISSYEQEKTRADLLAESYELLDKQIDYKSIEIGKPVMLYDGTRLTVYNIQVYEPNQVVHNLNDQAKYIAIAVDIEIDKNIEKIRLFNSSSKSITLFTDKDSIDKYFVENVFDIKNNAYNPNSMKWTMQELVYELQLWLTPTTTKLDPYYTRLGFDKESAQPSIFSLWSDYEQKKNTSLSYIDAPRKLRGWILWIFKVDEAFINDKVDYSFVEGLVLHYKNASGNLTDFSEELGKTKK